MAKSGFQVSAFCKPTLKPTTTTAMPSPMDTSEFPPLAAPSSKISEPITPRPKITLPVMGGGKVLRILDKPISPTPEEELVISAKTSGPAAKKGDEVNTTPAVLVIKDTQENLDQKTLVDDVSTASNTENKDQQGQTTSTKKCKNKKKNVELSTSTAKVQDEPIITRKKSEKKKSGQAPKMAKLIAQSQKQVTKIEQQQGMKKHVPKGNIPSVEKAATSYALSQPEITCSDDGNASDSSGRSPVCSDDVDATSSTDNTSTSQPARLLTQNEKRNQKSYAQRKKRAARNRAEAEQSAKEAAKATAISSELINKEIGKIISHIRNCAWDHEPDEDDLAMLQFSSFKEQKRLMQLAKEDLHHDMLPLYLLGVQLTPLVNKYALAPGAELTSEGSQMMRAIMNAQTGSFALFCDASYRVEICKRVEKMTRDRKDVQEKSAAGNAFFGQNAMVDFSFESQPSAGLVNKKLSRHTNKSTNKPDRTKFEDCSTERSPFLQSFEFSGSDFTFTSTHPSGFGTEVHAASTSSLPPPALIFGGASLNSLGNVAKAVATPQIGVDETTPMEIDTEVDSQGEAYTRSPSSDHTEYCSESDTMKQSDLGFAEDMSVASIPAADNVELEVDQASNVLISPASTISESCSIDEPEESEPMILDDSTEELSTASEAALLYVPVAQLDVSPTTLDSAGVVGNETDTQVKASMTEETAYPTEIVGTINTIKCVDALDIATTAGGSHSKDLHEHGIVSSTLDALAEEPSTSPMDVPVDPEEELIDSLDATHEDKVVANSAVEALGVVHSADLPVADAEPEDRTTFLVLATPINVGYRDAVEREPMFD